jgi:DNA-binding response OmpR family regulator
MSQKNIHGPRILVVEDDSSLRALVCSYLRTVGYDVVDVFSLASAFRILKGGKIDAIVLDLELEDGEGYDILRSKYAEAAAVIVTSVRKDVLDRVVSFELGADDYIIKPIELKELALRLKRSLRRRDFLLDAKPAAIKIAIVDDIELDLVQRVIVSTGYVSLQLTKLEFRALQMFTADRSKVLGRDDIARELLGRRVLGNSRAVDALMSKLRRKLDPTGKRRLINSVRGSGYVFLGTTVGDVRESSEATLET